MTTYNIYDNGGETIDRYTIVFRDETGELEYGHIGASNYPNTFYQHGNEVSEEFLKTQKLIDVSEVSPELQMAILRELQGEM